MVFFPPRRPNLIEVSHCSFESRLRDILGAFSPHHGPHVTKASYRQVGNKFCNILNKHLLAPHSHIGEASHHSIGSNSPQNINEGASPYDPCLIEAFCCSSEGDVCYTLHYHSPNFCFEWHVCGRIDVPDVDPKDVGSSKCNKQPNWNRPWNYMTRARMTLFFTGEILLGLYVSWYDRDLRQQFLLDTLHYACTFARNSIHVLIALLRQQ